MMKLKYKGLLTLGLNPKEFEHLRTGNPLTVRLDDLGLKGQVVVLITGASDEAMKGMADEMARRMSGEDKKLIEMPN